VTECNLRATPSHKILTYYPKRESRKPWKKIKGIYIEIVVLNVLVFMGQNAFLKSLECAAVAKGFDLANVLFICTIFNLTEEFLGSFSLPGVLYFSCTHSGSYGV